MPENTPVEPYVVDAPSVETDPPVPSTRARRRRKVLIEWLVIVVVAVVVSFAMRTFAFQTFFIPSASMEPTLQIGDRIIVSKLSVDFGTINRGDILVFKAPPAENCGEPVTDLVKRVIGLPNDVIYSQGNTIFINGKALAETWTHVEPLGTAIAHTVVPANQYFMMGDNHPNSCDSRMWGTVPKADIIGKAFLRIWPVGRLGLL